MARIGWLLNAAVQILVLAGLISMYCQSYVLAEMKHPGISIAVLSVLYAPLAFAQWRMLRKDLPVPTWLTLTFLTGWISFVCVLIIIQISFEMAHFPMKEVVELQLEANVPAGSIDQWYKDTATKRKAERNWAVLVLLTSAALYGTTISAAK